MTYWSYYDLDESIIQTSQYVWIQLETRSAYGSFIEIRLIIFYHPDDMEVSSNQQV